MKSLFFVSVLLLMTGFGVPTGAASPSKNKIAEIALERTRCMGSCPAYKVVLRRDGTASYVGYDHVERRGEYAGKVEAHDFDVLARLMQSQGFFGLKNSYTRPVTDSSSAIVSAVRGDERKTVSNYADAGPVELWGIEMAIDAVAAKIEWEKVTSVAGEKNDRITEITLERTRCFGTCPAYKVVLRRDGTAIYTGHAYVEREGTYAGKIDNYYFIHLAKLMESQGFFDLEDRYWKPITDMPSAIVSVLRDGRRKTVSNYANAGPAKLWGIEMAIDAVVAKIKWDQ